MFKTKLTFTTIALLIGIAVVSAYNSTVNGFITGAVDKGREMLKL